MQISQLYDFLKEEASGSCILDASELHLVPFQHSVGLFRGRCIDIFQNLLSNMLADIPIAWSWLIPRDSEDSTTLAAHGQEQNTFKQTKNIGS